VARCPRRFPAAHLVPSYPFIQPAIGPLVES
jgi:hypothetical protein